MHAITYRISTWYWGWNFPYEQTGQPGFRDHIKRPLECTCPPIIITSLAIFDGEFSQVIPLSTPSPHFLPKDKPLESPAKNLSPLLFFWKLWYCHVTVQNNPNWIIHEDLSKWNYSYVFLYYCGPVSVLTLLALSIVATKIDRIMKGRERNQSILIHFSFISTDKLILPENNKKFQGWQITIILDSAEKCTLGTKRN